MQLGRFQRSIIPTGNIVPGILCWFFMVSLAFPQEVSKAVEKPQNEQNQQDYRLGPGDVLLINVKGLKEFSRKYYVSNSGKIHIPYLGILAVTDLTPSQLQSEIVRGLREKNLLKEPIWVEVGVVESRAHSVYLLGEVMQPGQFAAKGDYHISDLIFQGVGFNEVRSRYGYLYRRNCHPAKVDASDSTKKGAAEECLLGEAVKVDFKELLEGNRPELNLQLRGGDILYVPERQPAFFYVVGDVLHAGSVEIPFNTQVLATQAIAWAGGPMKTAEMNKGLLLRYDEAGVRQELPVNFEAILRGRKPDFPVQPNDIIFVPGSRAKTLGYGLLGIIPGIASRAPVF